MAARLRPTDPQRLASALEVIDATGVSLAEWQGATAAPVLAPEQVLKLVVAPEREQLYAAIDARFDTMIEQGALEEVRALLALGLDRRPARHAGAWRARARRLSRRHEQSGTGDRQGQDRDPPLRQAADDLARRFMTDWEWVPDARRSGRGRYG